MSLPDSDDSSEGSKESNFQGQGYRLIDLNKFSSTISSAHVCEEGEISKLHNLDFDKFTCGRPLSLFMAMYQMFQLCHPVSL